MSNQTTIKISKLAEKNALHCQYPGQTSSQNCYIQLDCRDGWLNADYDGEIGNAVPMHVYHGHVQRWRIPCLTADTTNDLMTDIIPLAQRIVDGYEPDWDGNNMIATFTDDAQAAIDEISEICDNIETNEYNSIQAWDADSYWDGVTYLRDAEGNQADYQTAISAEIDDIGTITAKTTDDELYEIERRMDAQADADGVICDGTDKYLEDLRQACIDNTEND